MSTCTRDGEWEPDPKEISCDNNMVTNRQMIIPNSQHVQITIIIVGSLLGVVIDHSNNNCSGFSAQRKNQRSICNASIIMHNVLINLLSLK